MRAWRRPAATLTRSCSPAEVRIASVAVRESIKLPVVRFRQPVEGETGLVSFAGPAGISQAQQFADGTATCAEGASSSAVPI